MQLLYICLVIICTTAALYYTTLKLWASHWERKENSRNHSSVPPPVGCSGSISPDYCNLEELLKCHLVGSTRAPITSWRQSYAALKTCGVALWLHANVFKTEVRLKNTISISVPVYSHYNQDLCWAVLLLLCYFTANPTNLSNLSNGFGMAVGKSNNMSWTYSLKISCLVKCPSARCTSSASCLDEEYWLCELCLMDDAVGGLVHLFCLSGVLWSVSVLFGLNGHWSRIMTSPLALIWNSTLGLFCMSEFY